MITGNKPRLRDMVIPHNALGDRIRELERELLKPAMLEGVAYVPEEKLTKAQARIRELEKQLRQWRTDANFEIDKAEQRIRKAQEILESVPEDSGRYLPDLGLVHSVMMSKFRQALDALEGK